MRPPQGFFIISFSWYAIYMPHLPGIAFKDPFQELAAEAPFLSFSPKDSHLLHTNANFDEGCAAGVQQPSLVVLIPPRCFIVCRHLLKNIVRN